LNEAETAWQNAAGAHSADALRSEVFADGDLKSRAEEQLLDEETDPSDDSGSSRTRSEILKRRIGELTRDMDQKSVALAQQSAREENLEALLTSARSAYDAAAQRLADLRVSLGSRTERLRVIDPSIVPQRPSSPNVPLIVIGAASLALCGSLLYLTLSFSLTRGRRRYDLPLRMSSHGAD
jgi:uncharacterized protein involved in exopolysaccharide biosynthesis